MPKDLPFPKSFPNKEEYAFLRLTLCSNENFPALWREWKNSIAFEDIDGAVLELMPLIYLRLGELGIQDELYGRIQGIYRLAWVRNQRIIAAAREVAALCAKKGIPAVMLKGIPLLEEAYRNRGARFLGDADILIPASHGIEAMEMLQGAGWRYVLGWAVEKNNPTPGIFYALKASSLRNKGADIDVHWNIFPYDYKATLADIFKVKDLPALRLRDRLWDKAIPMKLDDVQTARLGNEDMLAHIIVHGAEGNSHRGIRWVVDAIHMMRNMPVDWNVLLKKAVEFGFGIDFYLAFRYMAENFEVPVPGWFLHELKKISTDKKQRKEYYRWANIPFHRRFSILGNMPLLWYAYFKFEPRGTSRKSFVGFLSYARAAWGLRNNAELIKFIYGKYRARLQASLEKSFPGAYKAFVDSTYIVIGRTLSFLASFAAVTVFAKYVPRETVGSYNYIMAALSIISITTLPGMNNALARAVGRGQDGSVNYMMKKRLLFGMVGTIVCAAVGIITLMHGKTLLGAAFIIAAPFVPLTDTFSAFAQSFWQGKKKFHRSASAGLIYYAGLGILSIAVFLLTKNLVLMVGGVMIAQTAMGLAIYRRIKRENNAVDKESTKLGMHLSLMQAFSILSGNIDKVIVWSFFGPAMLAVYTFASTPVSKANQMLPIGIISLPYLSGQQLTKRLKKKIFRNMLLLFLVSVPATAAVIAAAPKLYKIFFPLYPESVPYFQLLFAAMALSPLMLLGSAMIAFRKTRALYITQVGLPLMQIGLMAVLAAVFGMHGLIAAILLSAGINCVTMLVLFARMKTVEDSA